MISTNDYTDSDRDFHPTYCFVFDPLQALVRSITCWTIGRYSSWVVQQEGEGHALYFVPVMEGVSWGKRLETPRRTVALNPSLHQFTAVENVLGRQ